MIIALDLDGVFRNFTGALIRQFKLDYPHLSFQIPQFESQLLTWELEDYWPPEWTDERLKEYFSKTRVNEIYANALPYPGAIHGYKKIRKYCTNNDYKLIIITSASKQLVQLANWQWLNKYSFSKSIDFVYMRKDKYNVPADVLLDDALFNLREWQLVPAVSFPGPRVSVCYNKPWNQAWPGLRAYTYNQFISILEGLKQKVGSI